MGVLLLLNVIFALVVVVFGIMKDAPKSEEKEILENQGDIDRCPKYDADDLYTEEKYQRFCDEYKQFTNSGANWHRDKTRAKRRR